MDVREPEFYKLFCNFMRASFNFLKTTKIKKLLLTNSHNRFWSSWTFLLKNSASFEALEEYKKLEKWVNEKPEIDIQFKHAVGYGHIVQAYPLWNVLVRSIHAHLMQAGDELEMPLINGIYLELETFLYDTKLSVTLLTPLKGISINNFTIVNGLSVQTVCDNHELFDQIQSLYSDIGFINNVIIQKFELPKIVGKDIKEFHELTDYFYRKYFVLSKKLIETLRIFKKGRFGALKTYEYVPIIHSKFEKLDGCGIVDYAMFKEDEYTLSNSEINELKDLWNVYTKIDENEKYSNLILAIKKFMASYEKEDLEDRIVDLVRCFEHLFKKEKIRFSKKMAKRIGKFLGENTIETNKIARFMETAYDIRSDIIHAGNEADFYIDGIPVSFIEFPNKLEECVRECIKKYITEMVVRGKSKDEIIQFLDA